MTLKSNSILMLVLLVMAVLVSSCGTKEQTASKIDRKVLVTRHNVELTAVDTLASLSVGNGSFAYTVDVTGLQTFPEVYEKGVCLGTMSEWGWHSFPNTGDYKLSDTYKYYDVEGREIPYAVQWREPGRKRDAANYLRENPHRLHLGIVGLELLNDDKSPVQIETLKNIDQKLDMWSGLISSSFDVNGENIMVQTVCHPEKDLIGIRLETNKIVKGETGIKVIFPYPTGGHVDDACDFGHDDKHKSEIVSEDENSVIFKHTIDTTVYFARLVWTGKADLNKKKAHYFVLMPDAENTTFEATVEFNAHNNFETAVAYTDVESASAGMWGNYWTTTGVVDFSGTKDTRAAELERRIVLSQYLTRLQCASDFPPQETGLTFNSWYGKPHLEMHWWHGVHWAYWNRTDLLEKSLDYYNHIYDKAKTKAEIQGYAGVRWPKMTDHQGDDSPSGVGEFLIWQEPHIIYYAELCYRAHPDQATLEKYAKVVFATADFMADFARYDAENDRYYLGPPLIPAQESLQREVTVNPPFELGYWYWGLSIAQQWKERMGKEPNPEWQKVIEGLPTFARKDGLYLAAESAPDSYTNEEHYSDHPMVLGAFGILPNTVGVDTSVMANTFDYIEEHWNWDRTWGWDYPMAAMSATRLGKPDKAIDLLMKDVLKNTYLPNGHNYQGTRLRIYLPGNGGLLTAVAMMCAGYEGSTTNNPGFPKDWNVKWEGLQPVF
ncbi:hypothetical protein [Saccharicrinis sp. FJH54]|uniref:hypothetical protein n=1 Tax=Saccharicrinis sp. FJH54 TaxID=3344665 RepID=UPI0035D40C20